MKGGFLIKWCLKRFGFSSRWSFIRCWFKSKLEGRISNEVRLKEVWLLIMVVFYQGGWLVQVKNEGRISYNLVLK